MSSILLGAFFFCFAVVPFAISIVSNLPNVFPESPSTHIVNTVAWSPDGKRIAIGGENKMISVRDAGSGKEVLQYDVGSEDDSVVSLSWSPNGRWIASATKSGHVDIWETTAGSKLLSFPDRDHNHKVLLYRSVWFPDEKHILSWGWNGWVVWDPFSGIPGFSRYYSDLTPTGENMPLTVVTLDISHGLRILVSDQYIRKTYWLDPETGSELDEIDGSHSIYVLSLDGKYVVMNDTHDNLSVTGDHTQMLYIGHSGHIRLCRWLHNGTRIASVGNTPDSIHVWDPRQPDGTILAKPLVTFKGHSSTINSLSWSPNDSKIVSGSEDGTAQIWDARSGQLIRKITF